VGPPGNAVETDDLSFPLWISKTVTFTPSPVS